MATPNSFNAAATEGDCVISSSTFGCGGVTAGKNLSNTKSQLFMLSRGKVSKLEINCSKSRHLLIEEGGEIKGTF